jgi:hypothetical protein
MLMQHDGIDDYVLHVLLLDFFFSVSCPPSAALFSCNLRRRVLCRRLAITANQELSSATWQLLIGRQLVPALWHQVGWSLFDCTDPTSPQLVLSDTPPQLGNSSSWYICDCEVFKLFLNFLKRHGIRYLLSPDVDQSKLLEEPLPFTRSEYFCKAVGNHVR